MSEFSDIRAKALDLAIKSLTVTQVTLDGSRTYVHSNGIGLLKRAKLIVDFVVNGTIPENPPDDSAQAYGGMNE